MSQYPQGALSRSSRFTRDPRELNRNPGRWNQSYGQKKMKIRKYSSESSPSNAASQEGCFNCGQKGCSVAKCPRPKNFRRIADNLSRWGELRKIERDAKVNLSMVSAICFCPSKAQEVLVTATFLNEQGQHHESGDSRDQAEEKETQAIQDLLHASALELRRSEDHDEKPSPWMDHQNGYADMYFISKKVSKRRTRDEECDRIYSVANSPKIERTINRCNKLYDGEFIGVCLYTGAQRSVCGVA